MDAIRESALFRSLSAAHEAVDIWDLPDSDESGWRYSSIVSKELTCYRILAYLRAKEGTVEQRIYDDDGDDFWIPLQ